MRRFFTGSLMLTLAAFLTAVCANSIILNPYESVNWQTAVRCKANLHTHTTESDGDLAPAAVIDAYKGKGYGALAIADHNKLTWPWSRWNRTPADVNMVGIPGTEASTHDHLGGYYTDYNGTALLIESSLQTITQKGGLAVIFHPGRYSRTVSWYVDLYEKYDSLIGVEVYNQGDRYPNDRILWDSLLTRLMPKQRVVWAFSNDDFHSTGDLARNWQVLLLPGKPDSLLVRRAIRTGSFYCCYDRSGAMTNAVAIDSIAVTTESIVLAAACADSAVEWIGAGGRRLHRGKRFDLATVRNISYVRAVIGGTNGAVTLTQPFGIAASTETRSLQVTRRRWEPAISAFHIGRLCADGFVDRALYDIRGRRMCAEHALAACPALCIIAQQSAKPVDNRRLW